MAEPEVPRVDWTEALEPFTVEFLITREKAVRAPFSVLNAESARDSCLAVAVEAFPHVQGYTIWRGHGDEALKTRPVVHVPLSDAWAFFGPKLNQAAKTLAFPVATVSDPAKFEKSIKEAKRMGLLP